MNWRASIANSLWVGSGLPAWLKFQRALMKPAETQAQVLRRMLDRNADCAYGRLHGFGSIQCPEDFALRVPVVDYEDLAPWIDRIRTGESRVLTSERVTHLIPTSGSSGARKLIPWTAGLQSQFNRAIAPWMVDLAGRQPGILWGPAYWSITPAIKRGEDEDSAVPIGFEDDTKYLGGSRGWLVRAALVAPAESLNGAGPDEFRFQTLLCLLRQPELRLISVWHPSFLALLLDGLPDYWERALAQLRRERCRHVRRLEQAGPAQPGRLWPRLRLISCWGDQHAELSLADIRRRFPGVQVQPKGLLATEAFVTIPFDERHPVAVCSHYFEFIGENGRVHRVHELHEHESYEVVVTTAGGLWRYRMGDRVRVTGFCGKTPSLTFMGRSGNISDYFGEKLSEGFVAEAIRATLARLVIKQRFVLLAPDEDENGWRYTLYVEGGLCGGVCESLERALCQNPNYASCRDLGQLQHARLFTIAERGYERFTGRMVSEGVRLGDIKPVALSRKPGWSKIFSGDYTDRPVPRGNAVNCR